MPKLKLSGLSLPDANTDLDLLQHNNRSVFGDIPNELIIHMATFCKVSELANFSQSNATYLKLLFNQEFQVEKKGLLSIFRKKKENSNKNDEEGIDFEYIQLKIWKPLVCFYFPRFEKALNIKNWMHVLRRRNAHIKIHGNSFHLRNRNKDDIDFIENCEFIYKCPLQFTALQGNANQRFCSVCNQDVYNVQDIETFKTYTSKGYCVSLGEDQDYEGEMCYFED